MTRSLLIATSLATLFALPAQAAELPPLAQNQEIYAKFIPLGVADRLRDTCPEVEPAHFRVWMSVLNLRSMARAQGYTDDDIRGLKDDLAAKATIKSEVTEILSALGAAPDHIASHCKVAREQINARSPAGRLIRISNHED